MFAETAGFAPELPVAEDWGSDLMLTSGAPGLGTEEEARIDNLKENLIKKITSFFYI